MRENAFIFYLSGKCFLQQMTLSLQVFLCSIVASPFPKFYRLKNKSDIFEFVGPSSYENKETRKILCDIIIHLFGKVEN